MRSNYVKKVDNVLTIEDWDPTNFKFTTNAPRQNMGGMGASSKMVDKTTGQPIRLKIPECLTFGIQEYKTEDQRTNNLPGNGKYAMDLIFPEPPQEIFTMLENKMRIIESRVIDAVDQNSDEWLGQSKTGKKRGRDTLEEMASSCLKHHKTKENKKVKDLSRPPMLGVKTNKYGVFIDPKTKKASKARWEPKLFNGEKEVIFPCPQDPKQEDIDNPDYPNPSTLVGMLSRITSLIELNGVWFADGRFGISWKLVQGLVLPKPDKCDYSEAAWIDDEIIENASAPVEISAEFCPPRPAAIVRSDTITGHKRTLDDDDGEDTSHRDKKPSRPQVNVGTKRGLEPDEEEDDGSVDSSYVQKKVRSDEVEAVSPVNTKKRAREEDEAVQNEAKSDEEEDAVGPPAVVEVQPQKKLFVKKATGVAAGGTVKKLIPKPRAP